MARKATVTKEMILDSAFALMKEEGFEQVTARKLAAKAGCSTQPIFRLYENMEQLIGDVYEMAGKDFDDFYAAYPKDNSTPFVNLGMAYIRFAATRQNVFRLLFMSSFRGDRSMYDLLNRSSGAIGMEITKAKDAGVQRPTDLFMQMWIFIHGAACMSLTGDFDLSEEETLNLLKNAYHSFC
ncbi:MAG: TetR/AcrR family transcriptional regulator [Lachnospiraceae bacterium]|nr:TetR/AcrR family transcriptional regulator [Lachnospiraceae bacterium]